MARSPADQSFIRGLAGAVAPPEAAAEIASVIRRTNTSADLQEGMQVFLEKRPPRFEGR